MQLSVNTHIFLYSDQRELLHIICNHWVQNLVVPKDLGFYNLSFEKPPA